ncbi:MAG: hypothetical protein ACRCT6_01170, partial [Notoacmeibacter sp.]
LGFRGKFNGHEFHYTSIMSEEGARVFEVQDALGQELGQAGLVEGKVYGSFMHLIDRSDSQFNASILPFDEDD